MNANALLLTASLVDPTDSTLLSRLPDPTAVSIPAAFPVLIHIEPTAESGLSFSGVSGTSGVRIIAHSIRPTRGGPGPLRSGSTAARP